MNCLICNSTKTKSYKSRTGDFLSARIFEDKKTKDINLIHCLDCGFSFYDYRLNEKEIFLLYDGYRNSEYQKQRQQYDSWYTEEINNLIGKNETEVKLKKETLLNILNKYADINLIATILDYGGDKGQNIPDIKNAKKYVYEISNVKPVSGVEMIKKSSELSKYDLVISEGCLEHLSDINANIKILKSLIKENGYLYIQVPSEELFGVFSIIGKIHFLFSKYFSLKNILAYITNFKIGNHFKPMCEHQNFFTLKSLKMLLINNGLKIVYIAEHKFDFIWTKEMNIIALVKL